jgi:hypothetical protein
MGTLYVIAPIAVVLILGSIRQINQYERGVKFTCSANSSKVMEPGWRLGLADLSVL